MSSRAVLGCMYGDEAKAKIVDVLAEEADYVVRFQGGNNAGHTIWIQGIKYVFHMVPSGILYPHITCVIGSGVVLDVPDLVQEIQALQQQGISFEQRFVIDPRANIVLPIHKKLDVQHEVSATQVKIGTTQRGIGPAYADSVSRIGLKLTDLYHTHTLPEKVQQLYFAHQEPLDQDQVQEICRQLEESAAFLKPFVKQVPYLLNEAYLAGKAIIFEGAQGSLLDIYFGSYPYVTSSHTVSGGISIGTGFPPHRLDKILGVYKAYVTRVGEGPFPTELLDETGERIRIQGHEFGSTTGRPRRCGWFDAVAANFTAMINGIDEIAVTLVDVLSGFDQVKICTAYTLDGHLLKEFPSSVQDISRVEPHYIELPGWQEDITQCRSFEELPDNCQHYIHTLGDLMGKPIRIVSVGPDRSQTIFMNH